MCLNYDAVKDFPGRDLKVPSGSPRTGSGYALRQSYSVLVVAVQPD